MVVQESKELRQRATTTSPIDKIIYHSKLPPRMSHLCAQIHFWAAQDTPYLVKQFKPFGLWLKMSFDYCQTAGCNPLGVVSNLSNSALLLNDNS